MEGGAKSLPAFYETQTRRVAGPWLLRKGGKRGGEERTEEGKLSKKEGRESRKKKQTKKEKDGVLEETKGKKSDRGGNI